MHVQLNYRNEIPQIASADYLTGLVSGWQIDEAVSPALADPVYIGIRYRRDIEVDRVPMSDDVALELDPLAEGGTELTVIARSFRGDDNEVTVEQLLARAHGYIIEEFLKSSSDKMHEVWGRRA
ncbi:hypothetical protein SAMN04488563_0829 [Jiangella alkaliphila]|uniref:Uncharacterized protein n=2 Tax=Jiangella alkaliphila TaxID=419479 RepID=A0A1H2H3T2_9ACTN|nr:hypothetical protein SAMN04488563_0829 [Jiangella alkaliphila]